MPSEPPILPGSSPSPAVPPPLPGSIARSLDGVSADAWRTLHPLSIVVRAADLIKAFAIPLIAGILTLGAGPGLLAISGVLLLISALSSCLHLLIFRFRFDERELIIRQGLLERRERRIPFARVQDLSLVQNIVSRPLGLARVRVETAGGAGEEASLRYIAMPLAETLRSAVFRFRATAGSDAGSPAGMAAASESVPLLEVPIQDLVLGALSTRITASLLALLGLLPYGSALLHRNLLLPGKLDDSLGQATDQLLGPFSFFLSESTGRALLLIFGGLVFSVAAYSFRFYRFRLARSEDLLHREFGFFTRHSSSIPRRRIQLLRIEEPLLRRLFRRAAVHADTAADRSSEEQNEQGRGILAPILPAAAATALAGHVFPGVAAGDPREWRRVSPKAVGRSVRVSLVLVTLLTAALWGWIGPRAFALAALIPLAWFLARKSYQHTGYCSAGAFFHIRRGWLNRNTHIIPLRNIQGAAMRQSPFDRRLGLATLVIDTAGQSFTGGAPSLANLPRETAALLATQLAREAARRRYPSR
ncbi:MAG TPA: PH domain-containing protein [Verrucomicrobiales bacterium]|nr:PH domain-containing protein [Verrucomicrobiales bacterium]